VWYKANVTTCNMLLPLRTSFLRLARDSILQASSCTFTFPFHVVITPGRVFAVICCVSCGWSNITLRCALIYLIAQALLANMKCLTGVLIFTFPISVYIIV
jgi:hypothetical protein